VSCNTPHELLSFLKSSEYIASSPEVDAVLNKLIVVYKFNAAGLSPVQLVKIWNDQFETMFGNMTDYLIEFKYNTVQSLLSQVPNLFVKSSLLRPGLEQTTSQPVLSLSQDWLQLATSLMQSAVMATSTQVVQSVSTVHYAELIHSEIGEVFPPAALTSEDGRITINHSTTVASRMAGFDDSYVMMRQK